MQRNIPNTTNEKGKSIPEKRESLLKLNNDLLYGVYNKISCEENKEIHLSLKQNVLCCYPNQLTNLKGLEENSGITIIDIGELRKGKIKTLIGKEIDTNSNYTLLSNGVIELVKAKNNAGIEKYHSYTSLRDGGAADKQNRTHVAGRNSFDNLNEEIEREYTEECPFLSKINGVWTLATPNKENKNEAINDLKTSIDYFLKNKYNLDRNNPEQLPFIQMFERNFKGVKYEELGNILNEAIDNITFFENKELDTLPGLENSMKNIYMLTSNGVNSGKYYTYEDIDNNTIEYRSLREIKIPKGFNPRQRLFLESQNQYAKPHRLENLKKEILTPTSKDFAKKVNNIILDKTKS